MPDQSDICSTCGKEPPLVLGRRRQDDDSGVWAVGGHVGKVEVLGDEVAAQTVAKRDHCHASQSIIIFADASTKLGWVAIRGVAVCKEAHVKAKAEESLHVVGS